MADPVNGSIGLGIGTAATGGGPHKASQSSSNLH
jgi:hypothetical protein